MATYTYEIDTEHNEYPNLTVEKVLCDGEFVYWRVQANNGYVFYDTNAEDTEFDPETDEEMPVVYYYATRILPPRYDWSGFSLVAVPRDSVDESNIF